MRALIFTVIFVSAASVFAAPLFANPWFEDTLPDWFIPLREAVYEQNMTADEILPLYRSTVAMNNASLAGADLFVMLSRCEYMMGRVYSFEERNNEAAARFDQGMAYAERALEIRPSSEAWQMLAENLSQGIAVRSATYAMANGLRVERYSRNALSLNSRNAAAQYMIASRWVYAPSPLNNLRRGIEMMTAILTESDMEKDDLFNVYSAIGYAHIQQRRFADARSWLLRALEIYPTNKFVQSLLART